MVETLGLFLLVLAYFLTIFVVVRVEDDNFAVCEA